MYAPAMTRRARTRPIQLDSLRGFDAAARHLSFTQAAKELSLTQSSISRQVAALEDDVGQPLFTRKTRALELTHAGHRLAQAVRKALAEVDASVQDLRSGQTQRRVAITTFPSFASLWLIPRLPAFSRVAPGVELRIDSTELKVDLVAEQFDVAIRLTRADTAPRDAIALTMEDYTPVLAPSLIERHGPVKTPQDLARFTQLVMEDAGTSSREHNWPEWFALAGVRNVKPAARLVFNFIDQTLQAAARGQGVALGRRPFIDDFIERGELVAPFSQRLPSRYGYFLLRNPERADAPEVKAFCDWLVSQFAHHSL